MLHILKNRRDQARSTDDGFTLIELMVVVLIIAILLAIAIPTFLGAQNKAKDRSAQSSVRNALTAAKTIYSDTSLYTSATLVELEAVEPSLEYLATASTGPKVISVVTTATGFYAAALSATGTCFYLTDVVSAGGGTQFGKDDTTPTCTAAIAQTPAGAFTYADNW